LRDDHSSSNKLPIQITPPYLFIFLGASNLARGYSALANCLAGSLAPHPAEILHAMGPGRGYCAEGGIYNITYPPIGSCGILESASGRAPKARQVVALITDIGNDIMYGVPVSEITSCLNSLLQKLDAIGAEVFVHPIPIDFADDVSERQFRILRSIFYPNSAIDYTGAAIAVSTINDFLRDSAGGRVHLLPNMKDFSGIDKIHYSIFQSHRAWSQVAAEMLRVLSVKQIEKIGWLATTNSLFANMGRLIFCDMVSVRKKPLGTF